MAKKFKNKYRIASHRRPNWDYSADALYFLTIVTQNRECNLGNVVNLDGHIIHKTQSAHTIAQIHFIVHRGF